MDKLGDMDLFVRVVRRGGLAAAGRDVGLSPARMTARINGLEQRYGVRLLNRSTRSVTLTEEGQQFYDNCVRILDEVNQAETELQSGQEQYAGNLRVTATSDLGRQHVAAVLSSFVARHPEVVPSLHLSDGLVNLGAEGFDVGVRYGNLDDSTMVARRLAKSYRVLCAAPAYIERHGQPKEPGDLTQHHCLAMVRGSEPLTTWYFQAPEGPLGVNIQPARSSNDGSLIRQWALEGAGIALKSVWDVAADLNAGRLVTLLDDFAQDFARKGVASGSDLNAVYPARQFLPARTRGFIDALQDHFAALERA